MFADKTAHVILYTSWQLHAQLRCVGDQPARVILSGCVKCVLVLQSQVDLLSVTGREAP